MRIEHRQFGSGVQVFTLAKVFSQKSGFGHVCITLEPSTGPSKEEASIQAAGQVAWLRERNTALQA